jgi:hypothetical protein
LRGEAEPRILADLANAYRLNGDNLSALATVDEAIKVATERMPAFLNASLVLFVLTYFSDLQLAIR